jgi:hypothetical protein
LAWATFSAAVARRSASAWALRRWAFEFAMSTSAVFSPLGRLGIRVRDGDPLVALGHGRADFTVAVGLGDLHLRFRDGLRGGLLAEGVDVARGVGDVLHVHVDEAQADLLQLDLDPGGNVRDELVAVGVDFLDVHRRDDDAHLAEDDVLRELGDVLHRETEEAFGGVFHHPGLRGDPHGEGRGRVDADVLFGKGSLEFDVDGQGRQVEELVILENGPDEGRSPVVALCRLARADLSRRRRGCGPKDTFCIVRRS